jgi:hypothetical protein
VWHIFVDTKISRCSLDLVGCSVVKALSFTSVRHVIGSPEFYQ